jgi:flagellar biosynthesis/type III secretory pathway protein FliH
MNRARIIKRAQVAELRSVDAARAALEQEFAKRRAALDAERAEILEQARARVMRDSMQAATKVVMDAEAAAQIRLGTLEPQVAALVSATVAQVIGQMDQDEAVMRATRQALISLKDHRRARITASPDVAEAVRAAVSQIGADGAEVIDVAVDERLERGRTVLSSDQGHVEIGLADQIAAISEVWQDEVAT